MKHSKELVDFTRKASLTDLRIVEMHAVSPVAGSAENFEARFDVSSRVREEDDGLRVDFRIRSNVNVKDAGDESLLELGSTWGATYALAERPKSVDEKVRSEFQSAVVLMTVFPYIRELVHSTCARFGIEGVIMPMIKANEVSRVDLTPTSEEPPFEDALALEQ